MFITKTTLFVVPLLLASVRRTVVSAAISSSGGLDDIHARAEAAFLGGLIGDALALGGHYEYDAAKIKQKVGVYDRYMAPGDDNHGVGWGTANYHPGKKAGDMTDAGDVALMLLEVMASNKPFTFDRFADYWKSQIDQGYGSCNFQSVNRQGKCPKGTKPGYLNGGTKRTLQALRQAPHSQGAQRQALAANVNCLVSATHFAALFLDPALGEAALVSAARDTVFLSHRHSEPVAAADFLARALYGILHLRLPLRAALDRAETAAGSGFITAKWVSAKQKVAEAKDASSSLAQVELVDDVAITSLGRLWEVGKSEPIKVGKASPTEGALPAALYLALKYENSLPEALIANAGLGGDSAARGIVIGTLLAAQHGLSQVPAEWLSGLNARPKVEGLFAAIRANKGLLAGADQSEL